MKKGFTVKFVRGEGDPHAIVKELIESRIRKMLAENGIYMTNKNEDPFRDYVTGVMSNDEDTDICPSVDSKGITKG